MSLIKNGTCEKCGENFYWSIGHPDWFYGDDNPKSLFSSFRSFSEEAADINKPISSIKNDNAEKMSHWWFGMGNVCPKCAPPIPIKDTGINISVITK